MNYSLKSDANLYFQDQLNLKTNMELFLAIKMSIASNNETNFISSMQSFIQRIGSLLSDCCNEYKREEGRDNFIDSIAYISEICQDDYIYRVFRALDINRSGNSIKHSTLDVSCDIDETIHQYNRLIDILVSKFNLISLNNFKLSKDTNTNTNVSTEDDLPVTREILVNTMEDSGFELHVEYVPGDGIITRGLANTRCVHFKLDVKTSCKKGSLSNLYVVVFYATDEKILKLVKGINNIELPLSGLPVKPMEMTIYAEFKTLLGSTKRIKTNIKKNL